MKDDSIMQIFDTLNNIKTELKFLDKVTIYLCGVTVYEVRGKNIITTLKDFLTTATMLYSRNGLKNSL